MAYKYKVAYCGGLMGSNGYIQPNKMNIPNITSGDSATTTTEWDDFNLYGKNETDADAFVFEIDDSDTSANYRPKLHVFKSKCSPTMKCYYSYQNNGGRLISDKTHVWAKKVQYGNDKEIFVMTQYDDWNDPNNKYRLADNYYSNDSPYSGFASPVSIEYLFTNNGTTEPQSLDIPDSTNVGMFSGCTGITKCELPCQMRNISTATFSGCTSLMSYSETPDFVDTINASAFTNCSSMTNIVIGKYASLSGMSIFTNCSNATSIEWSGLNSGDTKERMTEIPANCFNGCSNLSTTKFKNGDVNEIFIPNGITTIGGSAFTDCTEIKDLDLNGVTTIGANAFLNCTKLSGITNLSNAVTIGGYAFTDYGWNPKSINIGSYNLVDVQNIGEYAFKLINIINGSQGVFINATCEVGNYAFLGSNINGDVDVKGIINEGTFSQSNINGDVNVHHNLNVNSAFYSSTIDGNVSVSGDVNNNSNYDYAFNRASISGNVTISGNVGYHAFEDAKIGGNINVYSRASSSAFTSASTSGSVTIGDDVADSAFESSRISGDVIVNGSVGSYGFTLAQISGSVTINGDVSNYAFSSANTTTGSVVFSGNTIGWGAFTYCDINGLNNTSDSTTMDLSNISNYGIGQDAFHTANIGQIDKIIFGKDNSELTIPIGSRAFYNFNRNITSLTLEINGKTKLQVEDDTFSGTSKTITVKFNQYTDGQPIEDWMRYYFGVGDNSKWCNVRAFNVVTFVDKNGTQIQNVPSC